MISNGRLKNLADAARTVGITRARMTQIMKLVLLAPGIQEAILLGGLDDAAIVPDHWEHDPPK